jgi:hypothetical protein
MREGMTGISKFPQLTEFWKGARAVVYTRFI